MTSWPEQIFKYLGHALDPLGTVVPLLADALGRLQVRTVGGPVLTGTHRTVTPAIQASVKGSAGSVVALWGFNKGASAVYVQLHNKTSAVADGNVPLEQILVPAGQPFGLRPTEPISFSTGIRWAVSTTPGACTLGSADVGITVEYL